MSVEGGRGVEGGGWVRADSAGLAGLAGRIVFLTFEIFSREGPAEEEGSQEGQETPGQGG